MSRQFWATGPSMVVEGFDSDTDVLVLDRPNLTRRDLAIAADGDGTMISFSSVDHEESLVILAGVHPFDLDPDALVVRLEHALHAGNVASVLSIVAEDVVWEVPGPTDVVPWAGRWEGHDGVVKLVERLHSTLELAPPTVTRRVGQGNTVVTVTDEKATVRTTGQRYLEPVVTWVTVRHGKVSLVQQYRDMFPVVAALLGGRPFTVPAVEEAATSVVRPIPAARTTDSIVLDPAELKIPPMPVRVVRQMYGALAARDAAKMSEVFATDAFWEMLGPADLLPWAGPRRGPDDAAASAAEIFEYVTFDHVKPVRTVYRGNAAAITLDEAGVVTATGIPFAAGASHFITTNRDGLVSFFRNHIDTTGIVEACLGGRPFIVPEASNHRYK